MAASITDRWWQKEFSPERGRHDIDFVSRDGSVVVELQVKANGIRSLYAGLMKLAVYLAENPSTQRGCLVLIRTRISPVRLRKEWHKTRNALGDNIARRLALVTIDEEEVWCDPNDPYIGRIANAFELTSEKCTSGQLCREIVRIRPGKKQHEVFKVLLSRWLRKQGPIPIGKLAGEIGCSYPTVQRALKKETLRNVLHHASNRSVELKTFPRDAWGELVALSRTSRNSFRFVDRSGEGTTPQQLLERLKRQKPDRLALGGVIAARHWHPDFDLHGIPRLDVACHSPDGVIDLSFVRKLDPALGQVEDPGVSSVFVVHPVVRASSLFVKQREGEFPLADPVETFLDLDDLSLTLQSHQMLTHLCPQVRLA
ncbi:MAG: hypothetical protein HQ581_02430 [Planctomycetes bacterium]|nr:hypothetical protein [Planctomycetota bacterium]